MSRGRSLLRAEYLLPIACLLAAALVAATEFSTIFEYDRGTSDEPLQTDSAADRHYYALLVLAIFAVVALAVAVVAGSRPAAAAVAAAGGISLLIFLLVDLPDVNAEGVLEEPYFFTSKAEPASGFWLELIGTVSLALAGGALATLRPEQLQMIVPERFRREPVEAPERKPRRLRQRDEKRPAEKAESKPKPKPKPEGEERAARVRERRRAS